MGDLVDCFLGSLLFQILVIPLRRKKKSDFGANLIRFIPKKDPEKAQRQPSRFKPLCPTRWAKRISVFFLYIGNYF
jgi:hypothetical protein